MQGDTSCSDFRFAEPLVLGPGSGHALLVLPPSLLVQRTHVLGRNLGSRGSAGRHTLALVKVAQRLLLQAFFDILDLLFHLLLYLLFTCVAQLIETTPCYPLMGHWPIFRAGEKTEARDPPREQMKIWTPPVCLPSGVLFHSGLLCSWFFAGRVTVHTKYFIFSCHTRLKTCLCPGWCAWELCAELLASVFSKKKKKFYLQDCVDGIHFQNTELKRGGRKRTALRFSEDSFQGKTCFWVTCTLG